MRCLQMHTDQKITQLSKVVCKQRKRLNQYFGHWGGSGGGTSRLLISVSSEAGKQCTVQGGRWVIYPPALDNAMEQDFILWVSIHSSCHCPSSQGSGKDHVGKVFQPIQELGKLEHTWLRIHPVTVRSGTCRNPGILYNGHTCCFQVNQ